MAPGEIFLASFLEVLLHRLAPREIINYSGSLKRFGKKLQKWRATLYAIAAVLNDAEHKQLTSTAVGVWLDDLKDLAYDVEDILDHFSTERIRRIMEEPNGNRAGASKVRGLFPKIKLFQCNMNCEIEEITRRLQEISEQKDKLGLKYIGITSSNWAWTRPPSSDLLTGVPVVGRDNDKEKIVELLSRDEPNTANFQVVAIVGMGGVGKTTLAQLVLNENDGVMEQFHHKIRVFVSDEFNLVRVTKAILESVTSQPCYLEEFNNIQESLSKELAGKKFLLILDDVWNTFDYDSWEILQFPFRSGAPGSKIIVTTRDSKVATTMGAAEVYYLQCISDDDCWKVFEHHALNVHIGVLPSFGLLREKIIARCSGLPLAARALGGLLGCKDNDEWEEILNNELWSVSDNESDILPVLKLSYHYLPSNLKRCFAYCSIFPNGYEFGVMQLILLWMAEGLLQLPEERKQMEDIGDDYFHELLSLSLFQKSRKENVLYVMHDLVGDLARWAAGGICVRLDDKRDDRCSAKTRHLSFISGNYDGVERFRAMSKEKRGKLEALSEVKSLRTFLPLTLSPNQQNYLTSKVTLDLVPNLQYLRVLSLNGYQISELPDSIGMLKYLRYLDLSHTLIISLPDSVSALYNLQTLILENCSKLKALPTCMSNLTNLRHLNISNVPALEGMPPKLSQLTNLQTLSNFVVGKDSDSRVTEIGPLLHLRGTLSLSRLENVIDPEDARQTSLINKEGLHALQLEWSETGEKESDVLHMLKPHKRLKELTIKGYGGWEFSTWMGDPLHTNVVVVRLENCNNCRSLPALGQLPSLKKLNLSRMSGVESVGLEFYGEGSLSFPLLETLKFKDMQHWKDWHPCNGDQGSGAFPRLKHLSIKRCPRLEGKLPENLDSLTKLIIHDCEELVVPLANYKQLSDFNVHKCKGVVYRSEIDFEFLESVYLSKLSMLRLQTKGFITGLRKVKVLHILSPTSPWNEEDMLLPHLISLRSLVIESSSQLLKLQRCQSLISPLTSLQSLHMYRCQSLVSIPEASFPPCLEETKIELCNSLTYFAKSQIPPRLRRIEIRECRTLKVLVDGEEEAKVYLSSSSSSPEVASQLEVLKIFECPSLACFSSRGQLPRTLKRLFIEKCRQLESITNSFHNNTCLEDIRIYHCKNLKSLPEGLCYLSNLQVFRISYCRSLVSFPRGGLPTRASNLKHFSVYDCDNLEALPEGMNKRELKSLQTLEIGYCGGLESILEEGFPYNLTSLTITHTRNCKPLSEWGLLLHQLHSLKRLRLSSLDPGLVLFPTEKEMEMLLPKSLIRLRISHFPAVKKLSKGFQFLSSLQSLKLSNCPKLASIPEEGLPLSLTQLIIVKCPVLEDRCKPVPTKGQYWPKISHIPYIEIGDWKVTDNLT